MVYRVDRIEGERVIFSDGARVESKSGQLISITSAIGGDMDVMAPPDGWTVRQTPHAAFWALRYSGHHPVHELGYELRAHVVESTVLRTEAGPFEVQHVSYSGWVRLGTSTQRRMKIDVWIAPSLHRVVRFRSEALFSGTYSYLSSNEEAVLSAIRHAGATPASAR